MLNLFSKKNHIVGLDIKPTHIRFVELVRKPGEDHILSYGEVVPEELIIDNGAIVNEAKLVEYLRDIKKDLKTRKINISLPDGANSRIYHDVLRKAGIRIHKLVSVNSALSQSLVPNGGETSFLVVDAEPDVVNFVLQNGGQEAKFYQGDPANHSVISNLNRIYIDWYDAHKEKIHYILFSGSRAKSNEFLEYVARETKLEIKRGNILVNLALDPQKIPIITREDSYKYAVAMGLALS